MIELSFYELIVEIAIKRIRPNDKLVLVILATSLINNECFASIKNLMLETGLQRKKVIDSLKNLESIGILEVKSRCELKDATPIYSINLEAGGEFS